MNTQLLIPAAGAGTRLTAERPKALVELAGVPLLLHTIRRFEPLRILEHMVVLAPPDYEDQFETLLAEHYPDTRFHVITGGAERQASVGIGLAALQPTTELVVIHDAARPFIDPNTVTSTIEAAARYGAATVATPCVDTVLEATEDDMLAATPDRGRLWACQTPQIFQVSIVREAYTRAQADGRVFTDDATLVNEYGAQVKIVRGSPENFKITTPNDLKHAAFLLREHLA